MAIDVLLEELLSLKEVVKMVPPIDGKHPHVSTLWRWCRVGLRGVHLDYLRVGQRVVTSQEALGRFARDLAVADEQPASADNKGPRQACKRRAFETTKRRTATRQMVRRPGDQLNMER